MKKALLVLAALPSFCNAQWVPLGNTIIGDQPGARSGIACALSGDGTIVAIGAPNNSTAGSNAGQVRVFQLSNGTWSPIGSAINGATTGDLTGQALSLSTDGSRLAIGEPFNNDVGFVTGQVRVFENVNGNWVQLGGAFTGETLQAAAGTSVDLSADGSIVAVGAPNTEVNDSAFAGNVRVFQFQGNNWVQRGSAIGGDGSIIKFGQSTSLSADGNTVAIGQTGDPTDGDTGRVFVYRFIDGDWTQLGNTLRGAFDNDEFGYRTRLSAEGDVLAVGTFTSDEVKVFQLIGNVWTQLGSTLTAEPGDSFGFAIDLSDDGTTLVAGARFSAQNGINSGRVHVFKFAQGEWSLVNSAVNGESAGDQFGRSVSVSSDGSIWAAGASGNGAGGPEAGHVRVFEDAQSVGLPLLDDTGMFTLFPNPADDRIVLQSAHDITSYALITLDGKVVVNEQVNFRKELNIDLQLLEQGAYIVRLRGPGFDRATMLLKQ